MASKCYRLITPITLLLLISTVGAIAVFGYATSTRGKRRDPPLRNTMGGHPPRSCPVPGHHRHPPLLSSPPALGTPSQAQTPPLLPSSPPTRAEPRPTCLVPSDLDTHPLHPCQEFREHPCPPPPSPPDGNSDANNQRSFNAMMDPSLEENRPQAPSY